MPLRCEVDERYAKLRTCMRQSILHSCLEAPELFAAQLKRGDLFVAWHKTKHNWKIVEKMFGAGLGPKIGGRQRAHASAQYPPKKNWLRLLNKPNSTMSCERTGERLDLDHAYEQKPGGRGYMICIDTDLILANTKQDVFLKCTSWATMVDDSTYSQYTAREL